MTNKAICFICILYHNISSTSSHGRYGNIRIWMLDQVLSIGLSLVGIVEARQHRQSQKRNIDDYKSYFGFKPVIHAQLWEDLQTTDIVEARIDITTPKGNVSIENLLWSQYFLKTYCTDKQRKGPTGHCEETGRKWCWHFLDKIQALKADKVSVCASNTHHQSSNSAMPSASHNLFSVCRDTFRKLVKIITQ